MFGGMIIIWVFIVGGIAWYVKSINDNSGLHGGTSGNGPDALELLKRHYVNGVITRDEFEEQKKVIEQ